MLNKVIYTNKLLVIFIKINIKAGNNMVAISWLLYLLNDKVIIILLSSPTALLIHHLLLSVLP